MAQLPAARSVCPRDCPDVCSMRCELEEGRIVRVHGDPEHPITQGFLCGRFQHYEEFVYHPDRVLDPLVRERKEDPFERVSWDEAIEYVCARFKEIVGTYGGQAILPYHYLGHMGIVSTRFADRLWNKMNTARVGAEICAMAGVEAMIRIFGTIRGTEPQLLDKTKLYIAWGKNPKETNVHGWRMIKDIHPLVCIDPYRSDTAVAADIHIRPRPGTDSLLAIGMMRILIERGWTDERFLADRTSGYEALREHVLATPLEEIVRETGIEFAQLVELTRLYAENRPSLIHIGVGLQRNLNGGEMIAAISMLGALTGQIGTPGGGVLYANYAWALNDISHPELRTDGPHFHNMVRLGRDLTANDEIKALYVYDQNPAVTVPNQQLVHAGLAREDLFVVVHDLFMTDTARFANVFLPACSFAEQTDLHLSYWHDYAQINNQVIEPIGEARSNYRTFQAIARGMGYDEPCFSETEDEVIADALVGSGLDVAELKQGPVLWGDATRTSFDEGRFPTPSGRLELVVPTYTRVTSQSHRYRFITPKTKHLQGSQAFNLPRKWPTLRVPWLYVHPDDAAAEGIEDGDRVLVSNQRGSIELVASISDRVQRGLVVSYMVRWGENANQTTPDDTADMGGNSTFHSNYVDLLTLGRSGELPVAGR